MKQIVGFVVLVQVCTLVLAQTQQSGEPCPFCQKTLELGLVLDSSSSISQNDFNRAKAFLEEFLSKFKISQDEVRVSIITYGRVIHPELSFNLTTYDNNQDVNRSISALPHKHTDKTETGAAIRFMREQQLVRPIVRPGVRKVGVVITDGNSHDRSGTAAEARRAREDGIEMYAIGVGSEIDQEELVNIAGDGARVDTVYSYEKLQTITDWLVKSTCPLPQK